MDNTTITSEISNSIALSRRKRWLLFSCMCFLSSCLAICVGLISSAVFSIKDTFQISDKEFGLVGTVFNAGNLIGSFLFIGLSNVCSRKYVLLFQAFNHCLCLSLCSITTQFYMFLFLRALSGSGTVFWAIYFMLWIDQFGMKKWKAWMISLVNLSGQISMLWGYLLNLLVGHQNWRLSLRIQTAMIFSVFIILLFVPEMYFANNLFVEKTKEDTQETRSTRMDSIFAYHYGSIIIEQKQETIEADTNNVKKGKTKPTIFTPLFVILTLAKSAQFFVAVTLMFWFTDYATTALNITDNNKIFLSFSIVCILANITGIILSGIVSNLLGYGGKNTLLVCLILKSTSCLFGSVIPFTDNFFIYSICLFFYNVFDALVVLLSHSVVMGSVADELKGPASGVFSILVNAFAFLPSTYTYGYLKKLFGEINPKYPLRIIMFYGFTSIIYYSIGLCIQKKNSQSVTHFKEEKQNATKEEVLLKDVIVDKRGK